MAVEDMARIRPTASDDFQGRPIQSADEPDRHGGAENLQPAQPEDGPPHLPEERRAQFEADDEKHHDHAELGEVHHVAAVRRRTARRKAR